MFYFIDACEFCGEFHNVTLHDLTDITYAVCDKCLDMIYEEQTYMPAS